MKWEYCNLKGLIFGIFGQKCCDRRNIVLNKSMPPRKQLENKKTYPHVYSEVQNNRVGKT